MKNLSVSQSTKQSFSKEKEERLEKTVRQCWLEHSIKKRKIIGSTWVSI